MRGSTEQEYESKMKRTIYLKLRFFHVKREICTHMHARVQRKRVRRRKVGRMYVVLREGAQARRCYTILRRYIHICMSIYSKVYRWQTKVI